MNIKDPTPTFHTEHVRMHAACLAELHSAARSEGSGLLHRASGIRSSKTRASHFMAGIFVSKFWTAGVLSHSANKKATIFGSLRLYSADSKITCFFTTARLGT